MAMPGMHADLPSMRSVGYRQAWNYLSGLTTFDAFKEAGIAATRQLAKRQMTWMRSMQGTLLLNPDEKVASLAVLKKKPNKFCPACSNNFEFLELREELVFFRRKSFQ